VWPSIYGIIEAKCAIRVWVQSGSKYIFVVVAHVLGVSELQCLCDLSVCDSGVFPKLVGESWLIWSMDVHLPIYVNSLSIYLNSLFMWSLLMYACRLLIAPMCMLVGIMLSKYVPRVCWWVCL
jgi:hypothetical protein